MIRQLSEENNELKSALAQVWSLTSLFFISAIKKLSMYLVGISMTLCTLSFLPATPLSRTLGGLFELTWSYLFEPPTLPRLLHFDVMTAPETLLENCDFMVYNKNTHGRLS